MNRQDMTKVVLVALVVGASLLGTAARAQLGAPRSPDPRVARALEAIGWNQRVDQDGDYVLSFGLAGQQQGQVVYIGSATATLGMLEVRQVFAAAIISESPFDAELLGQLLLENARVKVGSWRVVTSAQKHVVLFGAQVAADADPRALATIVEAVAMTAQLKRDSHAGRAQPSTRAPARRQTEPGSARTPLLTAGL